MQTAANWYGRVFALALPLILSNMTEPLLSTVDTVLSGHLPSAAALGGVAMSGIVFNGIFWSFGFLRMATTGLVAQARGANDAQAQRLHFLRALLAAFAIGAMIVAAHVPLLAGVLRLLGASGAVLDNARVYCGIRIWSAPAALMNYAVLGYLLGQQRVRAALLVQAFVNGANAVFAIWLVLGLHWGVAGLATATLCAESAGAVLGLVLCLRKSGAVFPLPWRELLDRASLVRLFALNRDILVRTLALVAAYALFTRMGARAGVAVLAANAVLMNLHLVASYALDGFANATETLVGEAVGARDIAQLRAVLRAAGVWAVGVAAGMSLVYLLLGPWLLPLFSNQRPVLALALRFLPWAAVMPIVSVWGFQMDGVFVGATRSADLRNSMVLSFAGFLLLTFVLMPRFGNNGLWLAFAVFMMLRGLTLGMRLPSLTRALSPAQ